MASTYCIVLTSAENELLARNLAASIVDARLAACVQVQSIQSVYRWKGEVCDGAEYLLLIKTTVDLYSRLEAHIRENHTYELPEIVQVPILSGYDPYLAWIAESTRQITNIEDLPDPSP